MSKDSEGEGTSTLAMERRLKVQKEEGDRQSVQRNGEGDRDDEKRSFFFLSFSWLLMPRRMHETSCCRTDRI